LSRLSYSSARNRSLKLFTFREDFLRNQLALSEEPRKSTADEGRLFFFFFVSFIVGMLTFVPTILLKKQNKERSSPQSTLALLAESRLGNWLAVCAERVVYYRYESTGSRIKTFNNHCNSYLKRNKIIIPNINRS